MKCLSCGTHISDESLDCPHCKVAQTNTKTIDHAPLTPQVQSTQPFAYYEQDTPASGTLPANVPAYIPSPPSSFSKKKLLVILIAGGGIAAVVFVSLVAFLFFNIYTTLQSYTRPVTMSNSTQLSLNPYIKHKETLALSDPLQNNSLGNLYNYHWMDDHRGDGIPST